jgi:hypothetical protein
VRKGNRQQASGIRYLLKPVTCNLKPSPEWLVLFQNRGPDSP